MYVPSLGFTTESTDPLSFCFEAEELSRIIEAVNSKYPKITFDIGHVNLTCEGNPENSEILSESCRSTLSIFTCMMHDNSGQWTEKYDGDENMVPNMVPGEGCADFSVLKLLSGYRGVYNFKVFSLEDILLRKRPLRMPSSFKVG